jgi:two-component system phosphate regulon response regulator PhoB
MLQESTVLVRPLVAGGVELDSATRSVRRGGRQVHLGPTEFRLLERLMRSPGRVLSRQQLVDAVWGHGAAIDPRTVDVNIGRLRKALGSGRRGPNPIRTVRGVGYLFA